jgi:XTP/dITP diphosphohydrolase
MDIVLATTNKSKILEIKDIFKNTEINIIPMSDLNITTQIEENGTTFYDNCVKKAETIMKLINKITLADDSGLEIDYLDKAPGVYSARFLDNHEDRNKKILEMLRDVDMSKRTARFICAIALSIPPDKTYVETGVIEGHIAYEIKGSNGFSYDSIFHLDAYKKNLSELSMEQKNNISHRRKAIELIKQKIIEILL